MIYLDNNATTKPDTNMLNAVTSEVRDHFGNPSSLHCAGQNSKDLVEEARESVANALGAKPGEIIFTSGGTEANNLAFNVTYYRSCSAIEHSSVYENASEIIPVTETGQIDIEALEEHLERHKLFSGTVLVSVMMVNNETGTFLDPENKLFEFKDKYDFVLHVDAVQAFGKTPISLKDTPIDMLSISAHKCHGLKGAGALFISDKLKKQPASLFKGGPHERSFRPGTENQIGILSLGYMSNKISNDEFYKKRLAKIGERRDSFEKALSNVSEVNGTNRICNTSNLYFPSLPDDSLELFLELLSESGVCASGKSACASGMPTPSRVLQSMFGKDSPRVDKSVRFSLSVNTTDHEIDHAVQIIKDCLKQVGEHNV